MKTDKRLINRDYIKSKSLIYIGDKEDNPQLIDIFGKAFETFHISKDIQSFEKIESFDVIVCNESRQSLYFLQEIRKLKDQKKPFLLLENANFSSNPIVYIKDNLSQYIKLGSTYTETMYIIQHALQNYDKELENMQLQIDIRSYLEILDKTVIVSRTDLKGNITYANDIFCDISKYSREELIGSPHNIIRHPDTPSKLFEVLWDTIKANNTWVGIIKNRDKNGDTYITQSTIAPYYKMGEKVGYIGMRYLITDDVNEKRKLKNHLTKLIIDNKDKLQQKEKEIEQLKRKNAMVDVIEEAWHGEKAKKEKLELQIKKFEKELREEANQHEQRVDAYLHERREYAEVIQKKDRKITALEEELQSVKTQNVEYERAMGEGGAESVLLKKRIAQLEDILKHQEEKLKEC